MKQVRSHLHGEGLGAQTRDMCFHGPKAFAEQFEAQASSVGPHLQGTHLG
jgi:hypothetical protein